MSARGVGRSWLLLLLAGAYATGCGQPATDESNGSSAGAPSAGGSGGDEQAHAGSSSGGSAGAAAGAASVQLRLTAPAEASAGPRLLSFSSGAAVRPGLESLEYYIFSIQICESMQIAGSGFNNPSGCLELYRGDEAAFAYELDADWSPLADRARENGSGFVNLVSPAAREALSRTTTIGSEHVRSYHYGIITWALPIKVRATLALGDGSLLYTHDGQTTFETIGADEYRDYFTIPATSLQTPPAQTAVILHGNGGNWFRFQNPLTITSADIEERRSWVLDLVFNPEGIVKGFAGDGIGGGNLRERDEQGFTLRSITVPMLDLAPVPHRADQEVVRESYRGSVDLGSDAFDVRLELYSIEGDPNATIYGVDVKSLVTPASRRVPPELAKISFVTAEQDGSLSFQSFTQAPIISGFQRVSEPLATTGATLKCATHADRAGAEGGAAIVVDTCPSENIDVTFTLMGRSRLDGDIPYDVSIPDAGANADGGGGAAGAGADAGASDAG